MLSLMRRATAKGKSPALGVSAFTKPLPYFTRAGAERGARPDTAPYFAEPYRMIRMTEEFESPLHQQKWRELLLASQSDQKIYQSPAFFQFLSETLDQRTDQVDLFLLQRCADGEIVGIVPVRIETVAIEFRLTRRAAWSIELPTVVLMGSAPMLARGEGAMRYLAAALLARYPHCRAVSLPACPAACFEGMGLDAGLDKSLAAHVLNGWQGCHTIPLPESFDAYLAKFSAKKRYNLSRQIRQWEQQAGPIAAHRIDRPDQVPALLQALRALMTPKEYGALLSEAKWRALAAHGLLLCYTVTGGDDVVAAILGTRACGVWHVHNIPCDRKYQDLSPGTSAVHLALQDAIDAMSLVRVDFGYGRPRHEFRSTHVLRTRGHVLFYSRRSPVRLLLALHRVHAALAAGLLGAAAGLKRRAGLACSAMRRLGKQGRGEAS
jgi:CelD/BcsL family acetyltransferase involved in cellulose biosynthesis